MSEGSSTISAKARRRAWAEWPLRTWLAGAIALWAVAAGLAIRRGSETAHERRIQLAGVSIEATVTHLDSVGRGQRVKRDRAIAGRLEYSKPEFTQDNRPDLVFPLAPGQTIAVGDKITVMTNPADGYEWRLVGPPPGYSRAMIPAALVLVMSLFPLAVAWLKRRTILTILRDGRSVVGEVRASRAVPLAPRSRLLKVQLDDGPAELLWPTRLGPITVGDTVHLLRHPRRPLAVAEGAYHDPPATPTDVAAS